MFDLDEFLQACQAAILESPVAVKELVERAVAMPDAVDATLGIPAKGGVVPLHRSRDFTVLHVIWPPGVHLYPHEHRMWAANGIYAGREENLLYRRARGSIVVSGAKELDAGSVLLLGDEAIHSVANPLRSYTAAIHVYGGDYFAIPRSEWDRETLEERPFSVEHLRRVLADADEAT
jgi:predicted metal-dependent enzyme (double-stranded beta helix superfamily)